MSRKQSKRSGEGAAAQSARTTVSVEDISETGVLLEELAQTRQTDRSVSADLSGGDVDARWAEAEAGGEETVGGSSPTPDQDVVEEIGRAVGVTYEEGEPLRVGLKEQERDDHRWELDPASSEDYRERAGAAPEDSEPLRHMRHHDRYK